MPIFKRKNPDRAFLKEGTESVLELSLNVVKSKYMIFKNKNKQTLNPKIDNIYIYIEQVTDLNCLGVIIDTNINWKKHVHV